MNKIEKTKDLLNQMLISKNEEEYFSLKKEVKEIVLSYDKFSISDFYMQWDYNSELYGKYLNLDFPYLDREVLSILEIVKHLENLV